MIKIIEAIIEGFKDSSEITKIHRDGHGNGSLFIKLTIDVDEALNRLISLFEDHMDYGELILARISSGEFIDMGSKTIDISGGYIMEYYDYRGRSHLYIRIYSLRDDGMDWTAIYIDWSIDSPWWR